MFIHDIFMEFKNLTRYCYTRVKNIKLSRRFLIISWCIIGGITSIWGFSQIISKPSLSPELKAWEKLAENGDTISLHKLLNYYNDNSEIYVEVVEEIDAYGNEINYEDKNESIDNSLNELYLERLYYWLNKGLSINDPVAKRITGMRLYYDDEATAIQYLADLAEKGDGQAALYCGSACFNQGKGQEAFKYFNIAYEMGIPSAGWHLAMCYSRGFGTEQNKEKAVEVLKHSALLNYPEAVLEMKRIEPHNPLWQNKADSLEIDFPDFVILDD